MVTGAFGVCLILLAIVTLLSANDATRVGAAAVAIVLGLLGGDALISALRDRRSLISRIGPLP